MHTEGVLPGASILVYWACLPITSIVVRTYNATYLKGTPATEQPSEDEPFHLWPVRVFGG